MTGLGLLALGLIIALSTFPSAGFFARNLRDLLCYLVGDLGTYAVAVVLLVTGAALVAQRHRPPMRATAVSLITLASMLRIPVCMHNVPDDQLFRPSAWSAFGAMDSQGADYRACANFGPLYGKY